MPAVSKTNLLIARLMWVIPVGMLLLAINQVNVVFDLQSTLEEGTLVVADVDTVVTTNRSEIAYDYLDLSVPMPSGDTLRVEKMTLPHSLFTHVQDEKKLDVRVMPGAAQEVVLVHVADTQWRIAAMNAAICFVFGILAGVGIYFWNKTLREKGDPAMVPLVANDP
ncbi:MAG: hypothetical protein RhofKO_15800 [Rhodothermales bacterium]